MIDNKLLSAYFFLQLSLSFPFLDPRHHIGSLMEMNPGQIVLVAEYQIHLLIANVTLFSYWKKDHLETEFLTAIFKFLNRFLLKHL